MAPPDGSFTQSRAAFSAWIDDRPPPTLSTNSGTTPVAFQGWRNFKESFAPELIHQAVEETEAATSSRVRHLLDPFGGSGTTALAGQFLGVRPTTIEVNPYLADLIECKLHTYDFEVLARAYLNLMRAEPEEGEADLRHLPATFVEPGVNGRYLFNLDVATRIGGLLEAIAASSADVPVKRLLRTILTSCAVDLSNAVVSGKGRRYRRNWELRKKTAADVDAEFRARMELVLYDVRRFSVRPEQNYTLLRGDSRQETQNIEGVDLTIFSPPYPNSFDYTDVYNIELWIGGHLNNPESNRALRLQTLRSHVQIVTPFERPSAKSSTLDETMDGLEEVKGRLWSQHIPNMVGAYFADMLTICRNIRNGSTPAARIYMVVGDSRYAGVDVPVAKILSELCTDEGFDVIASTPFRSMRASPQQGGQADLPETLVVLAV